MFVYSAKNHFAGWSHDVHPPARLRQPGLIFLYPTLNYEAEEHPPPPTTACCRGGNGGKGRDCNLLFTCNDTAEAAQREKDRQSLTQEEKWPIILTLSFFVVVFSIFRLRQLK